MNWDEELEARGVSPLSEAGILGRDAQYATALEVGHAMMNPYGDADND